jgi:hypothetical protein
VPIAPCRAYVERLKAKGRDQNFAAGDSCIEFGPTVVYNERAAREVRKAVADFMNATVLKK